MLNKFNHLNIKKVNTLFDSSMKLNDYCDKTVVQLEYINAIKSLMYIIHCIKPYITFITSKLSRYTSKLNMDH
jgi:hypothetical protein